MAEPEGSGGRITVSRDALRADLLDLELRLTKSLSASLKEKADQAALDHLTQNLNQVVDWRLRAERGEFTRAQEQQITTLVEGTLAERTSAGWTKRQRFIAVVTVLISVFGLLSSVTMVAYNVAGS